MRSIGVTLLLVLGLTQACEKDAETNCWDHTTREGCEAEGDACAFQPGAGRAVDGICIEDPDEGWCVPSQFGGSAAPTAWYEPATGRTLGLGLVPAEHPPGWVSCPRVSDYEFCPSTAEACQLCLCDSFEDDDGGGDSSESGDASSGDATDSASGG
jgi:hypothetical protein